jgi:hypothetical protein
MVDGECRSTRPSEQSNSGREQSVSFERVVTHLEI